MKSAFLTFVAARNHPHPKRQYIVPMPYGVQDFSHLRVPNFFTVKAVNPLICITFHNISALIGRTVVCQQQLPVFIGLCQDTVHCPVQKFSAL